MPTEIVSYDNRETCAVTLPSSCIPYTGYVDPLIEPALPCRPNINDVAKKLQLLIADIEAKLGDNTTLDKACLTTLTPATATQKDINQRLITELCAIKAQLTQLAQPIDPNLIRVAVNLLCLQDPACTPQSTYTVQELFTKLLVGYCNMENRLNAVEQLLNL